MTQKEYSLLCEARAKLTVAYDAQKNPKHYRNPAKLVAQETIEAIVLVDKVIDAHLIKRRYAK